MRRDALFAGGDLRTRLEVALKEMHDGVRSIDAARLLSTDLAELAADLVDRYALAVPRLLEEDIYVDEPVEARLDVSRDLDRFITDRSRPFSVPATTFTYHVPFKGDEELLLLQPSTMTSVWPDGTVRAREIVWSYTTARAGVVLSRIRSHPSEALLDAL